MQSADPTQRFSDRVADYRRWRPSYPTEIVDFLVEQTRLTRDWAIADIGSGDRFVESSISRPRQPGLWH